jgi:hypothetical protein
MTAIRRRISIPFSGMSGTPATVAEPEVGESRVPSVRTMVVLPAPFGPRNPEDLAVADVEGDILERDPVAEALAQSVHGQRRGSIWTQGNDPARGSMAGTWWPRWSLRNLAVGRRASRSQPVVMPMRSSM